MAKNLLKRNQVVSAEDHQNKTDVKKRKLEEVHHKLLSSDEDFSSSKNNCFSEFCQKKSLKIFDDKYLQTFNDFSKSGRILYFIL